MARTAGQQGDRQMASGSCLDDEERKNKMQEKTKDPLFKELGNTLCFLHFPAKGRVAAVGQGVREEAFSPRTPCLLPGDLLGWMSLGRIPESGTHRMRGARPLPMPGPALKNWTSANRKPFRPCGRQGFRSNQLVSPSSYPFLPFLD